MKAYVVRHGETEWNAAGRLQGSLDSDLNATGLTQMVRVARRCQGLGITRLWTSPTRRARQSAELIARAIPALTIEERADLRECDLGELEGKTRAEAERICPGFMQRWLTDPTSLRVPGAEPVAAFVERVGGCLNELSELHGSSPILVLTHAGVIRVLLGLVLGLEPGSTNRLNPSNGGISVFESERSVLRLTTFNETAHLHDA